MSGFNFLCSLYERNIMFTEAMTRKTIQRKLFQCHGGSINNLN